ncbi:E3 ubiquitin-protein ligase RNF14-like [Lolium rigidum]|uniref:E3 ubiquitin-protein ligase RNF14-like n=1 Tax=Lolium rigidum TaxID=89674 RepID=UPI001F5D7154|nr:E3 ubiquitin-protein ligase RNF14-like [Lolium rigidum]
MVRKSSKLRGGPRCVAPAPELHCKALNPIPIPAEIPECSRAAEAPLDAFVDIVDEERLGLDVPAVAGVEEEIVRALAEMGMELTEEELCANDQMQEDEILVLGAIFGDSLVMLNKKEGQRSFQIHVHIEIPDGIDVSARLDYGTGTLNYGEACHGDASDDLVYKFRVDHLPPILLTCYLPPSYPSHQPPIFTISTEWLGKVKLSSLCQMLDMIWEEQQGMEVIYQWVQWLQNSCLSHLGFSDEIILSKGDLTCDEDGEDKRACPDDSAPDVIIPRIMRYNDDKRHEAFLHDIHDCMICFSEYPGVDFIMLPCHHLFCRKCMQTYCKMHVKEGTVLKLTCPDTTCGGIVSPNILKTLLEEKEFERWEGLLLQRTLDAMNDLVYCPRCETACLEDECNDAVCPSCLFSFCTLCTNHRHVGKECMTAEERIRMLEERLKSRKLQSDQKKIDEARSLQTIMRDAKQCPRCKIAISKIEGCNKMSCTNCGHYFCYQCNSEISGYDHFSYRLGACQLFPQEEIDRWEAQMNPGRRRVQQQVDAPVPAPAPVPEVRYYYPCPTCGKQRAKIGNNNHIRCSSCRTHFCALCRKTVDKTSRHFGPRGCKQHTADQ